MFSNPYRFYSLLPITILAFFLLKIIPEKKTPDFAVIAYYAGNGQDLDKYKWEKITHVIYSFCHLKGQELAVDNAKDSVTIRNLVALKKQYKHLKVMLSLGGWGGCKTCSPVFATAEGREVFARSVKKLSKIYRTDGLDLDWEYPGIEGVPGHPFMAEDKQNFTLLVQQLRKKMGKKAVLSFAAGGFDKYFDHSIEWDKVMPLVDYVNLMSYDLVGGYSKITGHHTPLYSSAEQTSSGDYGVKGLIARGVPTEKIIIGAAFYGRSWSGVENVNKGLYQAGTFKSFIPHHRFDEVLTEDKGFVFYRDPVSKAPYAYSPELKEFATFDDMTSIKLKTQYAEEQQLGGIMFWQLTDDREDGGLLEAIDAVVREN